MPAKRAKGRVSGPGILPCQGPNPGQVPISIAGGWFTSCPHLVIHDYVRPEYSTLGEQGARSTRLLKAEWAMKERSPSWHSAALPEYLSAVRAIPGEFVDLLHSQATVHAAAQGEADQDAVIERGARPAPLGPFQLPGTP